MKRYLVFAYPIYYPEGGAHDLLGDFDGFDQAKTAVVEALTKMDRESRGHVFDTQDEQHYHCAFDPDPDHGPFSEATGDSFAEANTNPTCEPDGKCYFWNEVQADRYGPYETSDAAHKACSEYAKTI